MPTDQPFDVGAARRDAERKVREYEAIEMMVDALLKRAHSGGPISINSPEGDQITVSTTWLVAALGQARSEGFSDGRSIVQPLCDWANDHPSSWREAVPEKVDDPALRGILDTMLERA